MDARLRYLFCKRSTRVNHGVMPMSAESRKTDLQSMPEPLGPDRRAAFRYACRSDASCMMVLSHRNEARWARPRDISTTGIGLSISASLATGALALLEFSSRAGQGNLTLLAEVVRSVHRPDGSWAVGCRFDYIRSNLGAAARRRIQTQMRIDPKYADFISGYVLCKFGGLLVASPASGGRGSRWISPRNVEIASLSKG
jgi:PilZ domain